MNPENPYKAATEPVMKNALATMQPGESVIFEIKRHPIGILFTYALASFVLLAIGVIMFVVLPSLLPDNKSTINSIGLVLFLITAIIMVAFTFIANKVYVGNGWVLTSDSITQVKQTSLFDRQSSQLSLKNLEDVTAEQNGILSHIFNYGTLKAETAGEHSKFTFDYCPNPNYYAQQVLQAREKFEQSNPGE